MNRLGDYGVSITTGFILNLAIAILVISIVLLTAQGYMNNFVEESTETELRIAGERIATRIAVADRLVRAGNDPVGLISLEPPPFVSGSGYNAHVSGDNGVSDNGTVYVAAEHQGVNISVPFNTSTPVRSVTFQGSTKTSIKFNSSEIVVLK